MSITTTVIFISGVISWLTVMFLAASPYISDRMLRRKSRRYKKPYISHRLGGE